MTRRRNWLLLGPVVALAGAMIVVTFAPRARAAADHDRSPATHLLWSCQQDACRSHGKALGQTACQLDAASLANVLPKGSRVTCQRTAK
jgi:hypothetical protein